MEIVQHLVGVCGDTHSHIDLIDILGGGVGFIIFYDWIRYYIKGIIIFIKKTLKHE